MPDLPRQIRLAAGDYFMHGQDSKMRRLGLPGNVCNAVIRLGTGFDTDLFRRRVGASPILNWLGRVHIGRPFGFLPPLWRTVPQPRTILREHNDQNVNQERQGALPLSLLGGALHASTGPGLALDLIAHADGIKHLVLSWNHSLLDARGVDLVLSHLNSGNGALDNFIAPQQRDGSLFAWRPDMMAAQGSVKWLKESGREPLFSLVAPGPASPTCRNYYRVLSFSAQETARLADRCQQMSAGFRRGHFYLAATLRAFHNLAVRRGNKEGAYLIPVPHDTRRHGAAGPIFSNHLSILFYRIEPQQAGAIRTIFDELGRQMTNQIRDRFPECCMAALEMFIPLPLRLYVHHLGRPTRGKFATFCFSDSGEACAGMPDLLGAKILDVKHLVPTWRPPGLTILFLSSNGQPSTLVSWVDDCISAAEVDALEKEMRSALLEEPLG